MLDSLTISQQPAGEEIILEQPAQHYQMRHPYQVLRTLPKDATPAQQDSAIQAVLGGKTEIRYSERPDTLHLPGQPVGKSVTEVSVPQYYNETFFKNNNLFHPEIEARRLGIAGDPKPYTQSNDNGITAMIIFFILGTILAVSHLRHFIAVQVKEFFAPIREHELRQFETSGERLLQIGSVIMTGIMLSLLFFNYTQAYISDTFTVESEKLVMTIFTAETLGVIMFKYLLTKWVNNTFFPHCDIAKWEDSKLFLHALLGIGILPFFLLNVYWNLSSIITLVIVGIVYFLYVILLFYKGFGIFFRKNIVKLQIFLYLCTIEIFPTAFLWAILTQTAKNLTITY